MPDSIEALQLLPPGTTLRERLSQLVGQPVTVYLKGVHAHLAVMPAHSGWPTPPQMTAPPCCPPGPGPGPCPPSPPAPPCPPTPGPAPCPGPGMMGTTVVNGVLVAAGGDYLVVRVSGDMCPPMGPNMGGNMGLLDVLIPYSAVGLIVPGMMKG